MRSGKEYTLLYRSARNAKDCPFQYSQHQI